MSRLIAVFSVLVIWVGVGTYFQNASHAAGVAGNAALAIASQDLPLLDAYPGAYAAYSLRKLRSDYDGPAIRVRRSGDDAEQDFGFTAEGDLDIGGIEAWLGGDNGEVIEWYSQLEGHPSLTPTGNVPPTIAVSGTVHADQNGNPRLYFDGSDGTGLESGTLPQAISKQDFSVMAVVDEPSDIFFALGWINERVYFKRTQSWGDEASDSPNYNLGNTGITTDRNVLTLTAGPSGSAARIYQNAEVVTSGDAWLKSTAHDKIQVGQHRSARYEGYLSELVVYSYFADPSDVQLHYDNINSYWLTGPFNYYPDALLPQQHDYQITLYEWLLEVSVADVTLPASRAPQWDGTYADEEELAELWLKMDKASASRVVRGEPEWYVLDAGNGKGIEATGDVRIWHTPGGGLSRSWSNEPAYLYQLDIPMSDGSSGNPLYQNEAVALRALVVAAVDMMQYDRVAETGGFASWNDMYGKALLGWAEAYRWCKDVLPTEVQDAFERGMGRFLDRTIVQGARNANTNMDMFPMQAAAEIYMATSSTEIKQKAVQTVKRTLFGYVDGELGTNHVIGKRADQEIGGVFHPAGYVGENDTPEVYYNGESFYHLLGAYAAVLDRDTGTVPADWTFLEEILRRMSEWKVYQRFHDPDNFTTGPSGFSGRTSAGEPSNQAEEIYRDLTAAALFEEARPLLKRQKNKTNQSRLESASDMANSINYLINNKTDFWDNDHGGTPPTWNGWSPWVKETTYLPQKGWYAALKALEGDPSSKVPSNRPGYTYNKAFGGPPTGEEFWAYKDNDGSQDWAFYVEGRRPSGAV